MTIKAKIWEYSNSFPVKVSQNSKSYTCQVITGQLVHVGIIECPFRHVQVSSSYWWGWAPNCITCHVKCFYLAVFFDSFVLQVSVFPGFPCSAYPRPQAQNPQLLFLGSLNCPLKDASSTKKGELGCLDVFSSQFGKFSLEQFLLLFPLHTSASPRSLIMWLGLFHVS